MALGQGVARVRACADLAGEPVVVALDERGEVRGLVGRDAREAPLLGADEELGEVVLRVGLALAVREVGGRDLRGGEPAGPGQNLHLRWIKIRLARLLKQAEFDQGAIPVGRGGRYSGAEVAESSA